MKNFKLNWYKINPSNQYLKFPNKLINDVAVNPMALALLLTILSNQDGHFKTKQDLYKSLGWNEKSNLHFIKAIAFLKEIGYLYEEKGNYIFSNFPKFIKKIETAVNTEKKINYIIDDSRIETVKVEDFLNTFNEEKEIELPF